MFLLALLHHLADRLDHLRPAAEDGFSTAELLGNAALGVAALAIIWGGMRTLGTDVVEMIRGLMFGS